MGPYDPDAPLPQQFRNPVHCADPANDDHVYVCDRQANRIQVFRKDGTFVNEVRIAPRTFGDGSTWDIAFSRDPEQKYMYVADGKNMKVYVMDRMNWKSSPARRRRPPARPLLRRPLDRDRFAGQHLHDRDL